MIPARVLSVATALPDYALTQEEVLSICEKACTPTQELRSALRVFQTAGVRKRCFSFPAEYYLEDRSFEDRNADYIVQAVGLAARAALECLRQGGCKAEEIDHLLVVTTTGLATPSLDALLAPELGLRSDCRRWPIFGLGCAGGAGALVRAADLVRRDPSERVLVVAIELAGQVFHPRFRTPVDFVGNALFGEGAAAALVSGNWGAEGGLKILRSRTELFPGTRDLMGWRFTGDGMRLLLSRNIPEVLGSSFREALGAFLREEELQAQDISAWILHPGGRKILETYKEALGLSDEDLEPSRRSLSETGNLASASVLFILDDVIQSGRLTQGRKAILAAVGPGFGTEMALLEG